MHANEAGRFADESGRPRKKEGRLFLTRSHPVPRFFEQHACTHTWNLVTGDQGKKLSLSLSRFFFYVTRSHQDHPHCHPPFRFHCRLSPLSLQPRHRCKLHAYAITLHIYIYVCIYSCLRSVFIDLLHCTTNLSCNRRVHVSSLSAFHSTFFDAFVVVKRVRYARQCYNARTVVKTVAKQYASSTSTSWKLRKFPLRAILLRVQKRNEVSKFSRNLREIRVFEYSKLPHLIARFEFQRYRKVCGYRVGTRTCPMRVSRSEVKFSR